jgi:hypothetical protein
LKRATYAGDTGTSLGPAASSIAVVLARVIAAPQSVGSRMRGGVSSATGRPRHCYARNAPGFEILEDRQTTRGELAGAYAKNVRHAAASKNMIAFC